MNITKICRRCKTEKPLEEFRNQSKSKDGKKSYCIVCDDEYNKLNYRNKAELRIRQARVWQKLNPQKVKDYQKEYQKKYREKSKKNGLTNSPGTAENDNGVTNTPSFV